MVYKRCFAQAECVHRAPARALLPLALCLYPPPPPPRAASAGTAAARPGGGRAARTREARGRASPATLKAPQPKVKVHSRLTRGSEREFRVKSIVKTTMVNAHPRRPPQSRAGAASGSEGETVSLEAFFDEVCRDNGHLEVG